MRFLRCCSGMDRTPVSCRSIRWEGDSLISLLLLVLALVGCATKPPRNGVAVDIDTLVSRPISRAEIIQKLGSPEVRLEQDGILTYRIAHRPKFPSYYVILRNESGHWNEYSLVLVFDYSGILKTHSLIVCGPSSGSRTNIHNYTTAQFKLVQTTRQEMMLALGAPDLISPDERFLAYGYYAKMYRKDAFVAEFDDHGKLRGIKKYKGIGDLGSLMPPVKEYEGRIVHLSCYSVKWYPNLDKVYRLWMGQNSFPVSRDTGLLLLTDKDLLFISGEQSANAEPALRLPYLSMGEVQLSNQLLYVCILDGAWHAFGIGDRKVLREAQRVLGEKTTPTRP
jgi:hypothetical protein